MRAHLLVRALGLPSRLVETLNSKVGTLAAPDFDPLPPPPWIAKRLVMRAH